MPTVVLELEHPARRPCPVVLCRTDSKQAGCPGGRNTLRRSFPTARRGFIFPLPVCWSLHPAASPLTHTVRKHKGEHGASYQRSEEEPLWLQREAPQQAPEREPGARTRRAQTAERVCSTWISAGGSAEEPARPEQPALSDTLGAQPTRSLNAFVSPNSCKTLLSAPERPEFPTPRSSPPVPGT